jgi:hypothetical protein
MKEELVKIADLVFDSELYPRMKVAWFTAYSYAQAMRSGKDFPPIIVGVLKGKKYVVDGWHRVEARKLLKEEYIQAMVRKYDTEKLLFEDAVRYNNAHGKQLSMQEKTRIIDKMKAMHFKMKEISELVMIPMDKLKIFENRVLTLPNGSKVYLKSLTANSDGDMEGINQDSFSVRHVGELLTQLVELFEHNAVSIEDVKVKDLAVHLYELLGKVLQLA